ncbi:hypothetical protein [Streptomyces sp. 6N223]|uniref:hypothetical protein n=1 Tax=Streptomyces sp. 6N223 TaxID=3457412 RepID=UPI003FD640C8
MSGSNPNHLVTDSQGGESAANSRQRLREMIDKCLSDRDRSLQVVNDIEHVLTTDFLETEIFEVLADAVSLYQPGAGMPYMDEAEMAESLASARALLIEGPEPR